MVWKAATLLLLLAGCNRRESGGSVAEPYLPDEASVAFALEPLQGGNGSQQWIGTYASQGKIARFRIEFGPAKASVAKAAKDFDIKSGEGRFTPETGSDSSVLLADLRKPLQAKNQPQPPPTRTSVPFTFANIEKLVRKPLAAGLVQSRLATGQPLRSPRRRRSGGEVFLNLNPKIRKGQVSMKDPDYGDLVLGQLAKVL